MKVHANASELYLAFVGGLNSTQFSNLDVDGDGKKELILFDRTSAQVLVLKSINSNEEQIYIPMFKEQKFFPSVRNWMLMTDYDGDGLEDIFTNTNLGIRVFKTIRTGNQLNFSLMKDPLLSRGFSANINILVNASDIPAIVDWDNDGDLDVFNFNFTSGSRVEYHQNQSIERFGHADSLVFVRKDDCFGGFEEITCNNYKFGLSCPTNLRTENTDNQRIEHIGPGSILIVDLNNDGNKDLLIGKDDCDQIVILQNKSKATNGVIFDKIDGNFPLKNPFKYFLHPFAFYVDTDADGEKEFLISTNLANNANRQSNFEDSVFWVDDDESIRHFLQPKMIDVGENAAPFLVDIDEDGDLDLVIGSKGRIENSKSSAGIWWFENINNQFHLSTRDLFGVRKTGFLNLIPQFVDYDNDGKTDLLLTITDIENFGQTKTLLWKHNGKPFHEREFSLSETTELDLPLNQEDVPHFVDLNNNGFLDALVGKNGGALIAYENQNGSFAIFQENFGGINNQVEARRLSVFSTFFDNNADLDLILTHDNGKISIVYDFLKQNPISFKQDPIFETLDGNNFSINGPNRPIIFADKGWLAVGNIAGGIHLFEYDATNIKSNDLKIKVYPNPFSEDFVIEANQPYSFKLFDMTGRTIFESKIEQTFPKTQFNLVLKKGVYLAQFKDNNSKTVRHQKMIVR
ncbi:MAG: T9SS type A sorting domain-containing protein [Cytophagales bacterium]